MKRILAWWYNLSLPKGMSIAPKTPMERERLRYARLTSGFLLLTIVLYLPGFPVMFFDSPPGSSSPFIACCLLGTLAVSFVFGRIGWQIASAACIIGFNFILVTGVLVTNPLDPSLFPIVYTLLFALILSGALMPPVASIALGVINCIDIILIAMFVPHTANYNAMIQKGLFSVLILQPILLQVGIAVMIYVIMNNLLHTIRRADRAEEIVSLQEEMAEHEHMRLTQQAQLEEGIRRIAEVHARIANGDLRARVSLTEGDVLWSVAVPLNNLLNRLQSSIQTENTLERTQQAARYITMQLRSATLSHQPVQCAATGTLLDPTILELNKFMHMYAQSFSQRR